MFPLESKTTVSTWPETTIALTHFFDRSLIGSQELVHDFARSLIGVREHLPVRGNRSKNWKLFSVNSVVPNRFLEALNIAVANNW